MNFAEAADRERFAPVLVGLSGNDSFVSHLRGRGFDTAVVGERLENLEKIVQADQPFVAVVHRSGEREAAWDDAGPLLARLHPAAVIECNIFGHSDGGSGDSWRDGTFCYAAHTLWRHWCASGSPPPDTYLDRHRLIYNPVAPAPEPQVLARLRHDMRRELDIPDDAFVIGDICRPSPEKLDGMLGAIASRIMRHIPNARIVTRRFPEGMASRLQAICGERYINLPTTVDETELMATYAVMDVLAHFSTMGESFGMAIAEAMRCGLPVVANETPGIRYNNAQGELVQHRATGYLANDCQTAFERLSELAQSPALRTAMGQAAQDHFTVPMFSAAGVTDQLESWAISIARDKGLEIAAGRSPSPWLPERSTIKEHLLSYRDVATVPNGPVKGRFFQNTVAEGYRLLWRLQRRLGRYMPLPERASKIT